MVFIHVYHSKAWLVDDYRDPALETNITTTVTGAATLDRAGSKKPRSREMSARGYALHSIRYEFFGMKNTNFLLVRSCRLP